MINAFQEIHFLVRNLDIQLFFGIPTSLKGKYINCLAFGDEAKIQFYNVSFENKVWSELFYKYIIYFLQCRLTF